jgi:hypothetical protein
MGEIEELEKMEKIEDAMLFELDKKRWRHEITCELYFDEQTSNALSNAIGFVVKCI